MASIDQAALAGIGVAGVISISAADGPYTPFDAVLGVVLLVVFIYFYEQRERAGGQAVRFLSAPAAVLALILCLIVSPAVQLGWIALDDEHWREFAVDLTLAVLWLLFFRLAFLPLVRRLATRTVQRFENWQDKIAEKSAGRRGDESPTRSDENERLV